MNTTVPFSSVAPLHAELRDAMTEAFAGVYAGHWFIGGDPCAQFEAAFARHCETAHCVGCSNGLDALHLTLRALGVGEGDEVIVPSHTFIATALAVTYAGANVVLAEPNPQTYVLDGSTVEACITPRTRAVIAVHLYGQMADMEPLRALCDRHGLWLIEDAAQAHGARYHDKPCGFYGHAATFSFYPGKNLGALGDGGAVVTQNGELAQAVRRLANYGSTERYHHTVAGFNCRLDTLQAAFLQVKLSALDRINENRAQIAARYLAQVVNPLLTLPTVGTKRTHVWHIFAVCTPHRDALAAFLADVGIQTLCHYPIALCDQRAYATQSLGDQPLSRRLAAQELSLPLYYGMPEQQVAYVIQRLNAFRA